MAIFGEKMTIFGNVFEKMSSFWQFFDSQMSIFRRVRWADGFVNLPATLVDTICSVLQTLYLKP